MTKRRFISGLIVLLMVYLIVSLWQTVWSLWRAKDQVVEAELRVRQLAREQYELRQKLDDSESVWFLERAIRDNLHLVRPGENVVLLPKKLSEMADKNSLELQEVDVRSDVVVSNWELWIDKFISLR